MFWYNLNEDKTELTPEAAAPVKVLIKGHWWSHAFAYLKKCETHGASNQAYTVEIVDNEDSAHFVIELRNELAYDFGIEDVIQNQDDIWIGAVVERFRVNSGILEYALRNDYRPFSIDQITPEYLTLENPYPEGFAGLVQLYKDLLRDAVTRKDLRRLTEDILTHEWSLLGAHPRVKNFKDVLPKEYRRALIASLLEELRQEEETPSRRKPLHPETLIGTGGFDGFFLQLAKELNRAFGCGCYVATAALSRKLLEALLLSVMQKRYGSSHPEYYFRSGKPLPLERILSRFWRNFPSDFLQFSPTREEARLDAIRRNLKGLKDGMNVDVHEIGSLTDRQSLIGTKKQIQEVMHFLLYIDQRVGPESS